MKAVQLLLVTAPMDGARAEILLRRLKKGVVGVRMQLISTFPSQDANVLSPRQREVLREIAVGRCMKEVALCLGISVKTAETHRSVVMQRLGTRRMAELVRFAIQSGVVPASWLSERKLVDF